MMAIPFRMEPRIRYGCQHPDPVRVGGLTTPDP
jgi:hypothetical protein